MFNEFLNRNRFSGVPICLCICIIFLAIFKVFEPSDITASSTNINLEVLVCNNNAVCEDVVGETYASCPSDCPAPPVSTSTPPASGGGTIGNGNATTSPNQIKNIMVAPELYSATISLQTLYASLISISWGESLFYETGSLSESWYHNDFKVKIENLKPSTKYYFNISIKDSLGNTMNYAGSFITLSLPDTTPTDSPADLAAYLNNNLIVLNWRSPTDSDFSHVRLVRSDLFYPRNPLEGKVIYEGRGTQATDGDILPGKLYFYSLFAIDRNGNISNPAIISVYYPLKTETGPKTTLDTGPAGPEIDGSTRPDDIKTPYDPLLDDGFPFVVPDYQNPYYEYTFCNSKGGFLDKGLKEIDVNDISIIQGGRKISFSNTKINLEPNQPVRIELDASISSLDGARALAFCINNRIPEVRRGYMFTFSTSTQKFEVEIPTFFSTHSYEFYVGMLKYKSKETVLASGEFTIKQYSTGDTKNDFFGIEKRKIFLYSILFLIIILIILGLRKILLGQSRFDIKKD